MGCEGGLMMRNNKLDFAVVGFPKAGTTALDDFLSQHPSISMAYPKENHYFASDFKNIRKSNSLESYFETFEMSNNDEKVLGDSSVFYIYSAEALKNLKEHNENIKIIVLLREPIGFIKSMHSEALFNLDESEPDFEKAWNRSPLDIKKTCKNNREEIICNYKELSKISYYYNRLFEVFDRENVLTLFQSDLKTNPSHELEKVFEFLAVKNICEKIKYDSINVQKSHKNKYLAAFFMRPPKVIKVIWHFLNSLSFFKKNKVLYTLAEKLKSINYSKGKKEYEYNASFLEIEIKDEVLHYQSLKASHEK